MLLIDEHNVVEYLRRTGRIPASAAASAVELSGGVSNVVLRVSIDGSPDLVVKQSREKLRTQAEWHSRLDRVRREAALMRRLEPLLPAGFVPLVLFEDCENYLFAMEAVEERHVVWKRELLEARFDTDIAHRLGEALAGLHSHTAGDDALRAEFEDREIFDQLRIDPYYRHVAERHPPLREPIDRMIDEMLAGAVCVVHADFSPKNILVVRDFDEAPSPVPIFDRTGQRMGVLIAHAQDAPRLTLVDYETGHYGDPAFDLGFFLTHLMLKAVHLAHPAPIDLATKFWDSYRSAMTAAAATTADFPRELSLPRLERRTVAHLAACMLARIDGKSPVDYLDNAAKREAVRSLTRELLLDQPQTLEAIFDRMSCCGDSSQAGSL
ncbi:MAG: phosphotransferase [Planctomycetes bacterium]|nr:phosphotransferase [Planctomycetota bacterium]